MKTKIFLIIVGVALVLFVGYFIGQEMKADINLSGAVVPIYTSATNSSMTIATSSTAVFTTNRDRVVGLIFNNSTNEIWCTAGAIALTNTGRRLAPTDATNGSSWTNYSGYGGAVSCIAETSASTVSTEEK